MARLKRVAPVGVPQHIIQRGNNHQLCFGNEDDMKAYLNWLKEFSKKSKVSVHAWVLMTNHVHLLCTPNEEGSIGKMIQSIGRMYVRYFNDNYDRSGTLWEGRYKSCLVQNERYLLEIYRYIELNPVRANMVTDPGEYRWSSYACNALGLESELITPHREYLALNTEKEQRQENYRALSQADVSEILLQDIRKTVNRGLALGDERFKEEIEMLTKQRVTARKVGRPRRDVEKDD